MRVPTGSTAAVVGGGVAGLAAAHRLARAGVAVTLLEQAPQLGGKLASAEVGGVVVDVGAEALLNLRPEAVDLARECGLGDELVHPATTAAAVWSRDRMVPMPRTLMGVPADARSLAGLLSPKGVARAAVEARMAPPVLAEGDDVAIGALVEERLGKEVVDRLVEPLLGGVYAGHARELSARATVPALAAGVDGRHTLTEIAAGSLARRSDAPVFAGLPGGVTRLAEALVGSVIGRGATVHTGATVRTLARTSSGWRLELGPTRDSRTLDVDAVVLATPARATARLLAGVAPRASHELDRIDYASMAVLTFAFALRDLPSDGLTGSGFLVPAVDGRAVKAATYSARKWDWVRAAGEQEGVALLRVSMGRHREEAALQVPDEDLVEQALGDLADAAGLSVRPVDQHVQRWGGALPQYRVGHLDRVDAVRRDLAGSPGLAVCGAAYDGLGVPACIGSAHRAVDEVLAALADPSRTPT